MRKRVKEQLTELLNTMLESCDEINNSVASGEKPVTLLEDCQNAAIHVGESIEASEGEGTQAVSCLEKYCEVLFHISEDAAREELGVENIANMVKNHVAELKSLLQATEKEINKFPKTLEVVFFPYKASMWDSLESIWMAANEDPRCHAVVVPIPYVDRNPDGSVKEEHYEINLYPEEVPVIDYRSYPLDEIHPDIAFIHNPYDEKNLVTSVHPNYYSWRLKEHTDCLVYVPYFALPGNLDKNYSDFSAYHHVNYIVTQTPEHRKSFPSELPDDMFLPFGSPKFDAIIRKCKNPKPIPEAWRAKMEGKRTFFYNTSLRCAINEPDDYLKKMGEVFKAFAGRDDVCLVWRPHPLLEATFDSMQPEYAKVFRGLRELYIKQNIGIYDDTPCMEDTMSWCDAYLGDEGSSVVSSFSMMEKPIYILDNALHGNEKEKNYKNLIWYHYFNVDGDDRWIVTTNNQLWYSKNNDYSYTYVCELPVPEKDRKRRYYINAIEVGERVFIFPEYAQDILIYENGKIRRIELKKENNLEIPFSGGTFSGNKIWLIPYEYSSIVQLNPETDELTYFKEERGFFLKQKADVLLRGAVRIEKNLIAFGNPETDELLILNTISLEKKYIKVNCNHWHGTNSLAFENEEIIWLLPQEGYSILRYNLVTKEYREYYLKPEGIRNVYYPDDEQVNTLLYGGIAFYGDGRILICPNQGNKYVELDIETGAYSEWALPDDITDKENDYKRCQGGFMSPLAKGAKEGKRHIFYAPENRLFTFDFRNKSYNECFVRFETKDVKKYVGGFEHLPYLYCWHENEVNELSDIIDFTEYCMSFDASEQKKNNAIANASLDGTCGKKVIMELLEKRNLYD